MSANMSGQGDALSVALFATSGAGLPSDAAKALEESIAELGQKLHDRGVTLLTVTDHANDSLNGADVSHEHMMSNGSLSGRLLGELHSVQIVVGMVPKSERASEQGRAVHSLLRTAALDSACVVLVDPVHFPLLYKGAGGVCDTARESLAAHALRYLSNRDDRLARSLGGLDADDETEETPTHVLVIGGGGREHALALSLAKSPLVKKVFLAPGNGGTASRKIVNVADPLGSDHEACVRFAKSNGVSLVAIGPEQPLIDGLADALKEAGVACFGPSRLAARLEGSKTFSKDFMKRHGIATAAYESFSDYEACAKHLASLDYPVVVKASGLAAGKGVFLPETVEEAQAEAKRMIVDGAFGSAGAEVVIEERLVGEEVSVLGFCDGRSVSLMPGAQDHKRALDGDKGPNTGGMGAYAPAPLFSRPLAAAVALDVMQRVVDGCVKEGFPFVGVLYAGIMVTAKGPIVLEFNVRFGDPETQVLLPLLDSDLFRVMRSCTKGDLLAEPVMWKSGSAATVVLAAEGYPASGYKKNAIVTEAAEDLPESVQVYHAGTTRQEPGGQVLTSGGRVLAVTAVADELSSALETIYKALDEGHVGFPGAHFRRDIGKRALTPPPRLAVLGSTRGTDLQYVIDATEKGWLRASIEVVVSNKKDAYILTRAREHGLPTELHTMKGCASRDEFDAKVTESLKKKEIDLVLLIGYMRILSDGFVDTWHGRCLNVHPSLLPEFAGGMDLNVHQAVIDAKRDCTGCTIHLVTKVVDGGPIIVQRRCPVNQNDDSDTLKNRVQALEGPAFVEAIYKYMDSDPVFSE